MADIVLATLNAKYIHPAFGLRWLLANLGDLRPRARLLEFDLAHRPADIAESLLAGDPRILGLGVSIWNIEETTRLVALLKRLRPDLTIVLGGPEVSFETEDQDIVRLADYVIPGEADLAFADFCRRWLAGERPGPKVLPAPPPDLAALALPYDLYTDDDLAHRILYVETSRGCPYGCEFCLSSVGPPLRRFPLPRVLEAFQRLLDRGATQFKFVDRTFNLGDATGPAVLQFFHERLRPGLFLHFEMVPDRLPDDLKSWLVRFPPGALQLEIGLQTFNAAVAEAIRRRQDPERIRENLRFLRAHTGAHLHTDLIVGLPGETLESLGQGFDQLVALHPQEIQVGILKRLRGAPIRRHETAEAMVFSPHAPYEVLQTRTLDFPTLQRLRRFARYWDLVGNSGNFVATLPRLWAENPSPFAAFLRFSDWLHAATGRRHGISLTHLLELVFRYLTEELQQPPAAAAASLWEDLQRVGRSDRPAFVMAHLPPAALIPPPRAAAASNARRQARHRTGEVES